MRSSLKDFEPSQDTVPEIMPQDHCSDAEYMTFGPIRGKDVRHT